ncbi:hypothetical protein ACSBR1_028319 [Camellia fascicularis]
MFGFQKDNVANQREHLILLLANVHIQRFQPDQQPRLDDIALTEVIKKLFKNYKKWCNYLGRKSSLWFHGHRCNVVMWNLKRKSMRRLASSSIEWRNTRARKLMRRLASSRLYFFHKELFPSFSL